MKESEIVLGFKSAAHHVETKIARFILDRIESHSVSHVYLFGRENLEEARKIIACGQPLLVVANHLSNLDGLVVKRVFIDERLEEPVFILGTKLIDNIGTRFLIKGVKHISVSPKGLAAKTPEEEMENRRMNYKAFRLAIEVFRKGIPVVLFAEGTRARGKHLGKGLAEVVGFINKQGFVLPMGIWNTEEIIPVGSLPLRRGPVAINFGKPIKAGDIFKMCSDLEKDLQRQAVIDYVMIQIAHLLPGKYRGVYSSRDTIAFG